MNNVEYDEAIPAADQEPAEKKVISVENIPSVSMDELKQRLKDKISGRQTDRHHNEDYLKMRKARGCRKRVRRRKNQNLSKLWTLQQV